MLPLSTMANAVPTGRRTFGPRQPQRRHARLAQSGGAAEFEGEPEAVTPHAQNDRRRSWSLGGRGHQAHPRKGYYLLLSN
jgi:hypothetical protein